jgi:hypothetical protein
MYGRHNFWSTSTPNGSAPPVAGKDEERVAGLIEPLASVGTAPARAVPARARVTASSRGRNGVYAPPSQANAVGALAPPPAPLGASSAGPATGNPKALTKWFSGYGDLPKAAPTSSAAIDGTPAAAPAKSKAAPYTLATANSLAAIPDDRAALAVTLPPLRTPAPKVAALIEAGKKAATADDLEEAVRDFTEAVRIDPIYPGGYTERGQVLFKLGETDRAIADFS